MKCRESEAGSAKSGYAAVYYPGTLQSSSAASVTPSASARNEAASTCSFRSCRSHRSTDRRSDRMADCRPGQCVSSKADRRFQPRRSFPGPVRADGAFTIGVPPGQYTLTARTSPKYQLHIVDHEEALSVEGKSVVLNNFEFSRGNAVKMPEGQNAPESLWGQDGPFGRRPTPTNMCSSPATRFRVAQCSERPAGAPTSVASVAWPAPVATAGVDARRDLPRSTAGRFTLKGVTPGEVRLGASGLPSGWMLPKSALRRSATSRHDARVKPGDDSPAALSRSRASPRAFRHAPGQARQARRRLHDRSSSRPTGATGRRCPAASGGAPRRMADFRSGICPPSIG